MWENTIVHLDQFGGSADAVQDTFNTMGAEGWEIASYYCDDHRGRLQSVFLKRRTDMPISYEYIVVDMNRVMVAAESIKTRLNELGGNGWELCAAGPKITQNIAQTRFVLKRRVSGGEDVAAQPANEKLIDAIVSLDKRMSALEKSTNVNTQSKKTSRQAERAAEPAGATAG